VSKIKLYPIKNLPKSWQESIRFMGCGNRRDAVVEFRFGHSQSKKGYYAYCGEYPEEGSVFLGLRKP